MSNKETVHVTVTIPGPVFNILTTRTADEVSQFSQRSYRQRIFLIDMKINYVNSLGVTFILEAKKQWPSYVSAKFRWNSDNNLDGTYLTNHPMKAL